MKTFSICRTYCYTDTLCSQHHDTIPGTVQMGHGQQQCCGAKCCLSAEADRWSQRNHNLTSKKVTVWVGAVHDNLCSATASQPVVTQVETIQIPAPNLSRQLSRQFVSIQAENLRPVGNI